jgi:hypothetical protein
MAIREKATEIINGVKAWLNEETAPPYNFPTDGPKIIEGEGFFASIPYCKSDLGSSDLETPLNSEKFMKDIVNKPYAYGEFGEQKSIRLMKEELQKRGMGYAPKIPDADYEKTLLDVCKNLGVSKVDFYTDTGKRLVVSDIVTAKLKQQAKNKPKVV